MENLIYFLFLATALQSAGDGLTQNQKYEVEDIYYFEEGVKYGLRNNFGIYSNYMRNDFDIQEGFPDGTVIDVRSQL